MSERLEDLHEPTGSLPEGEGIRIGGINGKDGEKYVGIQTEGAPFPIGVDPAGAVDIALLLLEAAVIVAEARGENTEKTLLSISEQINAANTESEPAAPAEESK